MARELIARISALELEAAELRKDKARLDYLIRCGFHCYGNRNAGDLGVKSVVTYDKATDGEKQQWRKINLGPDELFDEARPAIDAALAQEDLCPASK